MVEKVKLAGGLEKTVTWVWHEDAQLKVEYYDFSEDAQRMFGNDIAYTLIVTEIDKLYSVAKLDKATAVQWFVENFKTYFAIKEWLEDHKIGFTVVMESNA
jgi:hypothetical protein